MNKIVFETTRLYVRELDLDDATNFFRLNGDEEIMRYIRATKTREESDAMLKEAILAYKGPSLSLRLAILRKEDLRFAGTFAILPMDNSPDLQMGYAFLKEYWGVGYATEIVEGGLPYAFEILQLKKIMAVTEIANLASKKVLLKNGFTQLHNYLEKGKEVTLFQIEKTI
jgi:[ribosomal protein S5]-alanine N-acetyltransferase